MQRCDGKGRYVRNPTFRRRSIRGWCNLGLHRPTYGENPRCYGVRVRVCVCACVCVSSCASYTITTLILCDFADVTFRWDAMDLPEGMRLTQERKSESGRRIILRLKSVWNQSSVCLSVWLSLSCSLFPPLLMIKTDVSPDCCACLMLSWRENISDVGNEYPRTEHSSQFDLCLQGPTALASMNWRGGSCYPTPTTTASPYRVRRMASSVTFTFWTHNIFFFSSFKSRHRPPVLLSFRHHTREEEAGEGRGGLSFCISSHVWRGHSQP